ncbi:hypothetical protein ABBQ38_013247 [Trebouxia sp. C0009 RCD-2024]
MPGRFYQSNAFAFAEQPSCREAVEMVDLAIVRVEEEQESSAASEDEQAVEILDLVREEEQAIVTPIPTIRIVGENSAVVGEFCGESAHVGSGISRCRFNNRQGRQFHFQRKR